MRPTAARRLVRNRGRRAAELSARQGRAVPRVPRAKIAPPSVPDQFVVRKQLLTDLDDASDVVTVCAPAGFGKTMLLADWVRTSPDVVTAWVNLDRDDNDPRRLWSTVAAAVAASPSVPVDSCFARSWRWPSTPPEYLAELIEALGELERPVRLILDDAHELVGAQAMHGLDVLIRHRPAGLVLVLSSRYPLSAVSRLSPTGELRELRADQLRFSLRETAGLLDRAGVHPRPEQLTALQKNTNGWPAGVGIATLAIVNSADHARTIDEFSGDERSMSHYLQDQVLSGMSERTREFLRVISVSDPIAVPLASELSGRTDAGRILNNLEQRTSLVTAVDGERVTYRIEELVRSHLHAELSRSSAENAGRLSADAARWWGDHERPVEALGLAARCRDTHLLAELLRRFAIRMIVTGDHAPLLRAITILGTSATATDPELALLAALTHLCEGEIAEAVIELRQARTSWPTDPPADLLVLHGVTERFAKAAPAMGASASAGLPEVRSGLPDLEPLRHAMTALLRLAAGAAHLTEQTGGTAAIAELTAAVDLARRHRFDYLHMQCLTLLAAAAACDGDLHAMEAASDEAVRCAVGRGWEGSVWSAAASSMLAYAALLRAEPAEAERLSSRTLAMAPVTTSPNLRLGLQTIHGAALFDSGETVGGLAEMRQARLEFGDLPAIPEQIAVAAMLEYRAALRLGHAVAARTVEGWLADRTGDNAELLVMRAIAKISTGHPDSARLILHAVVNGSSPPLLASTLVEAWLLEATLAAESGARARARRALRAALNLAEPVEVVRPFAELAGAVRQLLVHGQRTFGASDAFVGRVLAASSTHRRERLAPVLSTRELTVLAMLPSLLSLDEIAADLALSLNTVKTHLRSIYTKLGVGSRRMAVSAAHQYGLLGSERLP
jgi:LuxR family transcriptional regulator, maltose regulon positive regulatory protein